MPLSEDELKLRKKLRAKRDYLRRKVEGRIKVRTPEQYALWKQRQDAKRASLKGDDLSVHRAKQRAATIKWRSLLPEEEKEKLKGYRAQRVRIKRQDPLEANKVNEANRRWRKNNPEYQIKANIKRRTNLESTTTQEERDKADKLIRRLKRCKEHQCVYCLKLLQRNEIHIDHVVPVSRGGRHVAENLAVACAHCNVSKHAKLLGTEWVPPKDR